ncbi:MAG: hypothetical protein Q9160_001983 [Pyrenula sp. 1 TL-2023]
MAANDGADITALAESVHNVARSVTESGRYQNTTLGVKSPQSAPKVTQFSTCGIISTVLASVTTIIEITKPPSSTTTTYIKKTVPVTTVTITQAVASGYMRHLYARQEQDDTESASETIRDEFDLAKSSKLLDETSVCTFTRTTTISETRIVTPVDVLTVTSTLMVSSTLRNTKRLSSTSISSDPVSGRQHDSSRSRTAGLDTSYLQLSSDILASPGSKIDSSPSRPRVPSEASPTKVAVESIYPPSSSTITVSTLVFTQDAQGSYVVGTNTFVPGAPALTVSGIPVSIAPSATALIIGSSTVPLTNNAIPITQPGITVADARVTANTQGPYVIGSQTLSQGGPPIYVSNTKYSLFTDGSALIIGASTVPLQRRTIGKQGPIVTVAGQTVAPNAEGRYVVGSQTLAPGGTPVTISGTLYSLSPSGTALQVGSSIIPLAAPTPVITVGSRPITANVDGAYVIDGQTLRAALQIGSSIIPLAPSAPAITVGGHPIAANSNGAYVIDGQTLRPGGSSIIVSGTVYSLYPSGTALRVGSSTIPLTAAKPVITLGGQVLTADASGNYLLGSETLRPGGPPITASGTVYSLSPSGTALQVGSSTIPLTSGKPALTLGGQVFTADAAGEYVIRSQTLKPGGPPVTVSGTAISLGKDGNTVVVGGKTEVLASTTSQGIGGLIWSGVGGGGGSAGGGGTGPAETGVVQFTGAGTMGKAGLAWGGWVVTAIVIIVTVVFL